LNAIEKLWIFVCSSRRSVNGISRTLGVEEADAIPDGQPGCNDAVIVDTV
jgi:hypothetical protein